MANFYSTYLDSVIGLLQRIRDEEHDAVREAAGLMAEAIISGQRIFGFGCTHSSLPVQDVVYRAGGLALVNPIFGPGIASLNIRPTPISSAIERLEGYADILLDNTPIQDGDVLIIISVSGRNAVPVEMASSARERGIKVIGITSRDYSGNVTSRHPSGKKMHDFAHVVLDNKVSKGDAVLQDDRIPQKFTPASGVTSTALMHALVAATIEECLSRDFVPPVILAANVDGGEEYNSKIWKEYADRIFYL